MPSLVEIGPDVLEKNIFKFHQCIFAILLISCFGKDRALLLNRLDLSSPKNALCQVSLKLAM